MTQADVCEEKRGFAGRNPLAELIQLTPTGPSSAAPQSLAGAVCSGSLEVIELKPLKLGKRFPCALCNSECSWRACWAEDCPYCARTDSWERLQKFFWSDAIAIFFLNGHALDITERSRRKFCFCIVGSVGVFGQHLAKDSEFCLVSGATNWAVPALPSGIWSFMKAVPLI